MRTTLRLAYSKGLRDIVVSADLCPYPKASKIEDRYPNTPPADAKYEDEGRLVIVPADSVQGIEYFRSSWNVWIVYNRSGQATRATKGWRKDIFGEHKGHGIVQIKLPVVVE